MPRPQSSIWQYFTIVDAPDGKGRKAKCNYCSHQQACGVTRLHQHLLRKCTKIPESLHEDLLQKEAVRGKTLAVQAATQRSTMTQALQLIRRQQQNPSYQAIEIDRALTTLANNGITDLSSDTSLRATTGTSSQQRSSSSASSINNRYENIPSSPTSPSPHQYSSNNNSNNGNHSSQHHHHHHHHRHHSHHNSNSNNSSSSSATITNTLASSDPMSQRMLDYNLARALFSASIPFNVVNNQEFATFLKRMRPGYAVPKPHVLQQYLLKEEHYDLIPQDQQPSSSASPLPPSFDSNGSNVIAHRSPSYSSNAAPATSSAATISRIIHTQSISSSGNGNNNGSNQTSDVGSSSTTHTSRVSLMHRPTEMDGSL